MVRNLPPIWETWDQSLGWEDPLEEGNPMVGISHGVVESQTQMSD